MREFYNFYTASAISRFAPWAHNLRSAVAACRRRACRSGAIVGLAAAALLGVCPAIVHAAEPPAKKAVAAPVADDLAHAALLAAIEGDRESNRALLKQALSQENASPLAHWYAGEVLRDGRWISIENLQSQAASDKKLAEYHKQRNQIPDTPEGQLALARWCKDHDLIDIARIHWIRVLTVQPTNAEALKALDAVWNDGRLVTKAQLKQAQTDQKQLRSRLADERKWITRWTAPVAIWRRELKEGKDEAKEAIRTQVQATPDMMAIYALGSVMVNGSRQKSDPKGFLLASMALVDAFDKTPQFVSTISLARLALEHPTLEVRNAAADALHKCDKFDYVPLLVSMLQAPIEGRIQVRPVADGLGVTIFSTWEREGHDAIYRDVNLQYYQSDIPRINVQLDMVKSVAHPELRRNTLSIESNLQKVAQDSWRTAANYAANAQDKVDRVNAAVVENNKMVDAALSRATGEVMDAGPLAWPRWWAKYYANHYELETVASGSSSSGSYPEQNPNEYAPEPEKKPVIQTERTSGVLPSSPVRTLAVYSTQISCFPWNTKVISETGPMNISDIKPGDRVLSQHPITGKLDFQPVLEVTRRNPSPMIEIGIGKETIRTTRGHPFWVCGQGWKMAKELKAGMTLHSLNGPVRIETVETAPPARPWYEQEEAKPGAELSYNLILEDYHNYFVGDQRLLVHDNTLFTSDGQVPRMPGLKSQ